MRVNLNKEEKTANIVPQGRFDFEAHREFRDACDQVFSSGNIQFLNLDFRDVEYMDSSALGMLLLLNDKVTNAPGAVKLKITGCQEGVLRILKIANFDKIFEID